MANPKPWKDEETLADRYKNRECSVAELAEEWGCASSTIYRWLDRYNIETGKPTSERPPQFRTDVNGYEHIRTRVDGELIEVKIHRLTALAQGILSFEQFTSVEDVVHHENNIPWDNRFDNLKKMNHGDHSTYHNNQR